MKTTNLGALSLFVLVVISTIYLRPNSPIGVNQRVLSSSDTNTQSQNPLTLNSDIFNSQERALASNKIGNYNIVVSTSSVNNCIGKDPSLFASETTLKAGNDELSLYYSNGRQKMREADPVGWLLENLLLLGFPVVFFVLAIVCFPFLIIWAFCFSCCGGCCRCWCCKRTLDEKGEETVDSSENGCFQGKKCRWIT